MAQTVVIIQNRLLHYRVGFFEKLLSKCRENQIDLTLVHGNPSKRDKVRNDTGILSWSSQIRNSFISVGGLELIFQWIPFRYWTADLVILQQENRVLSSYLIYLFRKVRALPVAFWGHGINFQSKYPSGLREKWKKMWGKRVDWWFAYTLLTERVLMSWGYPPSQITRLNNSIDTEKLRNDLASWSDSEIKSKARELGISEGCPVGLFCGSLYQEKRLDFLISAADLIKDKNPDFHLIIVGDGPKRGELEIAAQTRPWIHVMGARVGKEKALYFRMAQVLMNPGLVGLPLIDAFVAGLIMVTTENAKHSPEIIYLENERNGVVTVDNVSSYAQSVNKIFDDENYSGHLSRQALEAGKVYSLDAMVDNFVKGIKSAISNY